MPTESRLLLRLLCQVDFRETDTFGISDDERCPAYRPVVRSRWNAIASGAEVRSASRQPFASGSSNGVRALALPHQAAWRHPGTRGQDSRPVIAISFALLVSSRTTYRSQRIQKNTLECT